MRFSSSDEESSQSRQIQWIQTEVNITDPEYDFVENCIEVSCDSLETLSSIETIDDTSSTSSPDGPLYRLSELMAQLPIRRGLSKYYQGKSESFGSLANLTSFEDLAKRSHRFGRPTKSSIRSGQSKILNPKGNIVKNKRSSLSFIVKSSLFSSFDANLL
ncbi:protein OXIDATIVE STRESS 3 [Lactuca sativa]|uniref:Uncharacterized protein n=1 Tax=Lactuca sativa TaxID=4236 RepID=A0A9R1VEC8_LACSA|nr:protein OXIDATIVE STRESS 3 [Lactuca sativa]KAJ0203247.1 hypothetical protein LSAT_V11C500281420 [Lactuca sativa]